MLISPDYVEQNREVHARDPRFGEFGQRYIARIEPLLKAYDCRSVLDYGAGKGKFGEELLKRRPDLTVTEYDPAVAGKEALPGPADMVLCLAVMEHVEPECVDEVLDHIAGLATKLAYFVITVTASAGHLLPDGRNPHLSVHLADWWLERLASRFGFIETADLCRKDFVAVCIAKGLDR